MENQFDSKIIPELAQKGEWFYGKRRFFSDFYYDFANMLNGVDFSINSEIDKSIIDFQHIMSDKIVFSAKKDCLFSFLSEHSDGIPVFDKGLLIDVLYTKRLAPLKVPEIATQAKPIKTYIIHDERSGMYKIGKSINPKVRERTLQSEVPLLKMILICDNDVEKELHYMYAEKRVRGEWFNLSENEILDIVLKYNFKDSQSWTKEDGVGIRDIKRLN